MASQHPKDNSNQEPEQDPEDGSGLTGLKRAWWVWKSMRHLFFRGERYRKALERLSSGLEWKAKQVDGKNVIVIQKKGVPRPTKPSTFKLGNQEFTLQPGQHIAIAPEAMAVLLRHLESDSPLSYSTSVPQSMKELEMTEEQFNQLLGAIKSIKEQNPERGFWQKYGAGLGVLATVLGLFLTVLTLNNSIDRAVSDKTAPIANKIESVDEKMDNLGFAINGNPATGAKGVNERLAAIEAKLPPKE